MRNPLARLLQRVARRNPFLLSHHPSCQYYEHHTFRLYGVRLCMGCFTVYPVGLVTLAVLAVVRALAPGLLAAPAVVFYVAAGAFAAPLIVSKAALDLRRTRYRVATKALLGVGLALVAYTVAFRPAARLAGAALFVGFLVPYVAYKGLTALDDCEGCPERPDFPDCSGMDLEDQ